ncbi:uncharacterized protein LOC143288125 [Babylonia areolata]|uniref:uncharacterized protein LOC143288125 n=1 Tax=Babylonia areolata TaxID=304850 RepID=UPI003FD2A09E
MLISCLKYYKYKLNRKALETMYKSFILPHFDYADILWDNCSDAQSNMLESLHLEAIRIIVGAVKGTSHTKLHEERRPLERAVPHCKTNLYSDSFIPSTTKLWNSVPDNIKCSDSLSLLKRYLSSSDTAVPPHYYIGNREEQIHHCRLRLNMSNLNQDLFDRHLRPDTNCSCGYPAETVEHFLLHCPNYNNIRENTIATLPANSTNLNTLLRGDRVISSLENEHIFLTVQDFIEQSKRFKS